MSPEGCPPVSDVPEAEFAGHIVRAAEVQAAASENPAHPENGTPDYSETHHRLVEVFGACGAVDAVGSQERGDQFLIASDRDEE